MGRQFLRVHFQEAVVREVPAVGSYIYDRSDYREKNLDQDSVGKSLSAFVYNLDRSGWRG